MNEILLLENQIAIMEALLSFPSITNHASSQLQKQIKKTFFELTILKKERDGS